MSLHILTQPFPWSRYSKKLNAKIERPRSMGLFTKDQSDERGMRLSIGEEGSIEEGHLIRLFLIVDPDDGIIVDAKFQAYGQSALIGAAEIACELMVGKNYDQAHRISAELIDKQVRDRPDVPAFPNETSPHLNLILEAIDHATEQCMDIPLAANYIAPPAPLDIGEVLEGGYPGWDNLSQPQKLELIEQIIARDIRPYIELDAGGVKVLDLIKGYEVHIAYEGSCTSCFSATGTTLSYIQQVLRAKIHPSLEVVPDLSHLH
ncbi:MAG: NifU family protein [Parachlamydiaceae bacterium]